MLLADYLSGEGYRVLKAENGEQAFEILATKPHLDLMITDYRLPGGVSGVQIAEPAVMLRPELKVIFISGYPAEILDSGSPIALKAPILAKPFHGNAAFAYSGTAGLKTRFNRRVSRPSYRPESCTA